MLPLAKLSSDRPISLTIRSSHCALVALAILFAAPITNAESAVFSTRNRGLKPAPQSEIIYEGMTSFGNYKVFGAAENAKLYTAGIEYDRELWPRVIGARVDYVSEILPVVLLSQPTKTDIWGNTLSADRKTVPGAGVTPIGFRLLWRDGKRWMPYFDAKASVLGFTQKALSPNATYENWSFHCTGGMKVKLAGRYDLRLGLLSDLHFSNAFVVRSNPALDVMNVGVGLVYHLNGRRSTH
ncbi:MAG: hypothetical protein ABSD67_17610 [Terracidiphilus sp.]|jgi:hypothetical protein